MLGLAGSNDGIRIAVCDDEGGDLRALAGLCRAYVAEHALLAEVYAFGSGEALLQAIAAGQSFDMLLLDICMDGRNGIETARLLRQNGYGGAIVYTTASTGFYAESYEVNAVHYLLKPFSQSAVYEALGRALRFTGRGGQERTITLTTDRQSLTVPVGQIRYVEVYNHVTFVYIRGLRLQTGLSLHAMAEKLESGRFLRCHRSYLVNMDYIDFVRWEQNGIVMADGTLIPLSRRKKAPIRQAYTHYVSTCVLQGKKL